MHYSRWRKTGDAGTAESRPRRKQRCGYDGCTSPYYGKGWCELHWRRVRTNGTPEPLIPRGAYPLEWGTWGITNQGYVTRTRLISPRKRETQSQHRHAMEQHLGRPLLRHETVHHVNGVRSDNQLENLELWSSSHPSGQRVADKLAWAREIVALYGELDALT